MAKFIINSTGDRAVRLEKVLSVEILPVGTTGYNLEIQLSLGTANECVIFESGPTLAAVQLLTAPLMAALEA